MGHYDICLELGSGGMASVYLARTRHRAGFDCFVALKRLRSDVANDPTYLEMFLDEARIAAGIRHPNVCSVVDFDTEGGEPYLVMELIAGEQLSAVRQASARSRLALPVQRRACLVARIIADACEGLHAAHELTDANGVPLEIVHRDISPDNVFVTYDGVAKVCDFGVARSRDQQHRTGTGVLKGKFAYIAPEILRGKRADRRADVWAVGVVLWELLTQKRLFFRNSSAETLRAVSEARIAPPSAVCRGIAPALDQIVARALSRNRGERYATARALGRDLTRFIGSAGEATGLADLAEWMEELFPGARLRKKQLVEIAARLETREVEPGSAAGIDAACTICSAPTRIQSPVGAAPRALARAWSWGGVGFAAVVTGVVCLGSGALSGVSRAAPTKNASVLQRTVPPSPPPPSPPLRVVPFTDPPSPPYVADVTADGVCGSRELVLRFLPTGTAPATSGGTRTASRTASTAQIAYVVNAPSAARGTLGP